MKVIISGTRDFTDYECLKLNVDKLIEDGLIISEIVSGNARGADKLGEQYAKENNIDLSLYPADWSKYGKSAGIIRNKQMAEYADTLIAFWDNKSPGTKNMIQTMKSFKKEVFVIKYSILDTNQDIVYHIGRKEDFNKRKLF